MIPDEAQHHSPDPTENIPAARRGLRFWRWLCATGFLGVIAVAIIWTTAPKHPSAVITVLDGSGNPVSGATITPDGLRPKKGGGHYMWTGNAHPPPTPVVTDERGEARVSYPYYVTERLETAEISCSVTHSDFVAERPFLTVSRSPTASSPFIERLEYFLRTFVRKQSIRPAPVQLVKGAVVRVSGRIGPDDLPVNSLYAQVREMWESNTNSWLRHEPDTLVSRQVPPGKRLIRLIHMPLNGRLHFSDIVEFNATSGETNELRLLVNPGTPVTGRLDASVPRPVKNGRVVLEVHPPEHKPQDSPPHWHTWKEISSDGTFRFDSLPKGRLEIVAICDGFVSQNNPSAGIAGMRHPQAFTIGDTDLDLTIKMEPSAQFEAVIIDASGEPVPGATVSFWPNVRWADWRATVFACDTYNTADYLKGIPRRRTWWGDVADFYAVSGTNGIAFVSNLPSDATGYSVNHPGLELPVVKPISGEPSRTRTTKLNPGVKTSVTLRMQKRGTEHIEH